MNLSRKYLNEVQYARALALFGVFAVHSSSTGVGGSDPSSLSFALYNFFNIAGKLGTPTFIFLSSFILFYTYYHRELTMNLFQKFYKKRLLYILVPYIVFSVFYYVLKLNLYDTFVDFPTLISSFLAALATGKAHTHLYFVFVSVQFYLMFPILLYLFKRFKFVRKYAIILGIVIQWTWVILNSEIFQVTAKNSIALSYFMFYFFGAFLGVYYERVAAWIRNWRKNWPVLAGIFVAYGMMIFIYVGMMFMIRTQQGSYSNRMLEFAWSTHAFFAAAVIFIVIHFIEIWKVPKFKRVLTEIGAVSFGMYLIHPFFLLFLRRWLPGGEPLIFHSWQLITFGVTFFSSWLIVRLFYDFVPYSWIVFGQGNRLFKKPEQTKEVKA